MATDKKHIAVYLDPAVEQALIAFCEQKGLKSKKGTMFSAGVNAALSEFFGISDIEVSNTPQEVGNTPQEMDNTPQEASNTLQEASNTPQEASNTPTSAQNTWNAILSKVSNIPQVGNIPGSADDTILPNTSNIPSESEVESLTQELEEAKADKAKFLESSTHITNKLRQEVHEVRSQLETERADREQVEAELAELKQNSATVNRNLPEAAGLLNQLKAKRRKSTVSLADVETLLEIIEKSCDDTPKGL